MGGNTLSIASDLAAVAELAASLKEELARLAVDEQQAILVEICVVEAVNNVIEHGYKGDSRQRVEVETQLADGELVIQVRDRSAPFDTASRVASAELRGVDAANIEALPERGMGLAIIKQVMNQVEYMRRDGMNILQMRLKLQSGDADVDGSNTSRS